MLQEKVCQVEQLMILRLFRSKFELLSSMLKQRHNLAPIPIKELKTRPKNESVDIIGIVNRKWVTKKDTSLTSRRYGSKMHCACNGKR